MNLAKAVAELITSNLKNGDGSPVECVISDSTIGRVAESAACAEKFEREGVGSTITVTSCWCYGAETMDMNPDFRILFHAIIYLVNKTLSMMNCAEIGM